MKQVRIAFSVKYDRCELSVNEHNPVIHYFLDGHFKRKQDTDKIEPNENDTTKVYNGFVEGVISERALNNGLPPTASLVFNHYALRPNQWGVLELQSAGKNHITIGEMVAHFEQHGTFSKKVPLLMHTVNNFEKGQIEFMLTSINLGGIHISEPLFVSAYMDAEKSAKRIVNVIQNYSQKVMQLETQMKDTMDGTQRIRVPYNLSESGLEMTSGLPLPAFSYVLGEVPESNTRFWENAFEQVMERDGLLPSDFQALNTQGKARVMANMITYMPTMLNYVADTVLTDNRMKRAEHRMGQQGIELFGDALGPKLSDDCDGLGTSELEMHEALLAHSIEETSPHYTQLTEIKAIASEYVILLSLDVVNGAEVQQKNAPLGAHMNVNMVPFWQFRDALKNTPEGRRIEQHLPWPKHITWDNQLPFMIGEGTGMYEPLGLDNEESILPAKAYVYSGTPSMGSDKKPIGHKKNAHTRFFVGSLVGMTPYFYRRGSSHAAFWYTNQYGERGALYDEMVKGNVARWGMKPQPAVPKLLRQVSEEATLIRQPPLPLVLSQETTHPRKNKYLDYVQSSIAKLNRSQEGTIVTVPIYIRPQNIASMEVAKHNASDLQRLEKVVGVDYTLEEASDRVYTYRLNVHVKIN